MVTSFARNYEGQISKSITIYAFSKPTHVVVAQRLADTMVHCCIDAFFHNIISLMEYIDVFFKMTKIRKHIKTLPVVKIENIFIKFFIEELPLVASCQNKQSNYESNCNRNRLSNDIGVMADKWLYKNKYCALCHGFNEFNYITLELIGCKTSTNNSGVNMTVQSQPCILNILED